jgi:hypothetical protein
MNPENGVGVGEFEQFDGRAVFNYKRDTDAVRWASDYPQLRHEALYPLQPMYCSRILA